MARLEISPEANRDLIEISGLKTLIEGYASGNGSLHRVTLSWTSMRVSSSG